MMKTVFFAILLGVLCHPAKAQKNEVPDSLAQDFRTYLSKNFSRYRTVNINWETKWAHNYTFEQDGRTIEEGRRKNLHSFNFSAMIPLLKLKNVSLYADLQGNSYKFEATDRATGMHSPILSQKTYNYLAGGLSATYYLSVFNKPLALSAAVKADGWDKGLEKIQGTLSAVVVFKHTERTTFTAGIMGMTLFSSIPIMPIVSYWHRFNIPNLSVDITFPSQFYLRYQLHNHRFSAGASMTSDNFYMRPNIENIPETCYFSEANLNPEISYEYIINKHIYIVARAGVSMVMMGGPYNTNRKGLKVVNEEGQTEIEPLVKIDRSPVPFLNVGISYSLFK